MTVKNLRPLGNRVLVKRIEAKTSKGGILLPDSAREKPRQAEVLAVGPGKYDENGRLEPLHVKVGDQILFSSYAGSEVKTDEEGEYMILSEEEILGIVEGAVSCQKC